MCYPGPYPPIGDTGYRMSTESQSDIAVSRTRQPSRSSARRGLPIPLLVLVGMILAAGQASGVDAQEVVTQDAPSSGRIVLDIPVRAPGPENSKQQVMIAVRGMKKSRSGAT